jgi:hypothetical protein
MVILIASFIAFFFTYTNKLAITTEKVSIQQTKNIINSSLAIVFASIAMKGDLDRLNELNGANPFGYMEEFNLVPNTYHGVVNGIDPTDLKPGWYFDSLNGKVVYKSYIVEKVYAFSVVLDYRDINGSGRFESGADEYQRLYFQEIPQR